MNEYVESGLNFIQTYGLQLIVAIAIYIVGKRLSKVIANSISKVMTKRNVEAALIGFAHSMIYWVLLLFTVIAALGQLGIQTASFVAVVGAAGLAIGLALQGSLSNFAAGVLILIFRPFRIGDYIAAAGTEGSVQEISIFTTVLTSPDNKKIIVPNSSVTGGNITNVTANDTRRIDFVFGISYEGDIDKARVAIMDVLVNHQLVLKDPVPIVVVIELADSSVNFAVRPWCRTSDYWGVYFDITEAVKKRLDSEGISIPYPQRDVHLHNQQ